MRRNITCYRIKNVRCSREKDGSRKASNFIKFKEYRDSAKQFEATHGIKTVFNETIEEIRLEEAREDKHYLVVREGKNLPNCRCIRDLSRSLKKLIQSTKCGDNGDEFCQSQEIRNSEFLKEAVSIKRKTRVPLRTEA